MPPAGAAGPGSPGSSGWSRGAWGEEHVARILAAAAETLRLWDSEISYPDLAEDIAAQVLIGPRQHRCLGALR
jgi:hypothetical protein